MRIIGRLSPSLSAFIPACFSFLRPTASRITSSSSASEADVRIWSRRETSDAPNRQTWEEDDSWKVSRR